MITFEKCDNCLHKQICFFKNHYNTACNAIQSLSYNVAQDDGKYGIGILKDSGINVSVSCPYILTRSDIKTILNNDDFSENKVE